MVEQTFEICWVQLSVDNSKQGAQHTHAGQTPLCAEMLLYT